MNDDLADVWADINAELSTLPMAVFPRTPDFLERPLYVFWPDKDWKAFLKIAQKAQCPIIYAQAEALGMVAGTVQLTLPEVEQAIDMAQHQGQVGNIELVFVIGAVVHSWTQQADWYDAYQALFDVDDHEDFAMERRTEVERQLTELAVPIEQAAQRLALMPEFIGLTFPGSRRDFAIERDAEIAEWFRTSGRIEAARVALDKAVELAHTERERRTAEAMANIDALADELFADPNYVGLAKVRQQLCRQFVVKKLGFRSPQVADRIYMRASILAKR
jgi:hypothetical protein